MKKIYSFLLVLFVVTFAVNAQDNTRRVTLNLINHENLTVQLFDGSHELIKTYDNLVEGPENDIDVDISDMPENVYYYYLVVKPTDGNILIAFNQNGYKQQPGDDGSIEIWVGKYSSSQNYTIYAGTEEEYYDKSVHVTVDVPESARFQLAKDSSFQGEEKEFDIRYSSMLQNILYISPYTYGELFYKVYADETEIISTSQSSVSYEIPLVKGDGDTKTYVENIVVTTEFPEDMAYTVTISFVNTDKNCLKEVTVSGVAVEDFDSAEGFKVGPGKRLEIIGDTDFYKFNSVTINDVVNTYFYGYLQQNITGDTKIIFDAEKYATYNATIIVNDPATVSVSCNYVDIELKQGENPIEFTEKSKSIRISAAEGGIYELTEVKDLASDKDYLSENASSNVYLDLTDGMKLKINAEKILRDKQFVLYIDDLALLSYGFDGAFTDASSYTLKPEDGYNLINFRDQDGELYIYAYMSSEYPIYHNGIKKTTTYSYTSEGLKDGDVFKMFLYPKNAIEHTVTFEVAGNVLDGYEVKKDILADVDYSQPVTAVGKTRFTIAPISRAEAAFKVLVGEDEIAADASGVYTFETESDTTVKIEDLSGIEGVTIDSNAASDVYNLQGIRVARQASADRINALPAGIYIINGKKVAVK